MTLSKFEKQVDHPTGLVDLRDRKCRKSKIIGQELQTPFVLKIEVCDAP
jgi:hypothetical protein